MLLVPSSEGRAKGYEILGATTRRLSRRTGAAVACGLPATESAFGAGVLDSLFLAASTFIDTGRSHGDNIGLRKRLKRGSVASNIDFVSTRPFHEKCGSGHRCIDGHWRRLHS